MGSHSILSLATNEGRECHRTSARHRVLLSAKLITTTDEFCVRLRDLSSTGAKVEGQRLPPVGKDVILKRGSFEIFATIVWCNLVEAGIVFDEPLTEGEVLAQASPPREKPRFAQPVYKRPGVRTHRLTPEEIALMKG